MDFARILPGREGARVISRIVMTPQNAKRLMMALKDNLEKFERAQGEITIPEKEIQLPPNFGGPTGYA